MGLLLTWGLIFAIALLILCADLIAYLAQRAGVGVTISQALLILSRKTRGVAGVVVVFALGILAGHLFLPRADGEAMSWAQYRACGLISIVAGLGSIVGTKWFYQRR